MSVNTNTTSWADTRSVKRVTVATVSATSESGTGWPGMGMLSTWPADSTPEKMD